MTNDDDTDEVLITLTELSERAQVSLRTLREWRKNKTLPPELFVCLGKRTIRCRYQRFLEWLDSLPSGYQLREPAPRPRPTPQAEPASGPEGDNGPRMTILR